MSTLATNAITDASGGNTTTINGYTPTVSNMAGRNRIINGDMRIDQRNAGASVTPTSNATFSVDRWRCGLDQPSKYSAQQVSDAPAGFVSSLKITSLSAYTIPANETYSIAQFLEGNNVADLGWGTANASSITLSFWVKSSLTGTFGGALENSGVNRSYPFSYSINTADTWEYKTITIPGDTTGTWLTTNGIGIRVWISLGSTQTNAAGAWVAGDSRSATGATSVVGTSGATFYITGVQLEAGTVATPFEHRHYGQELALCQRYYQVPGNMAFMNDNSANCNYRSFAVYMRVTPTMTGTPNSGTGATVVGANTTYFAQSGIHSVTVGVGGITASAEL